MPAVVQWLRARHAARTGGDPSRAAACRRRSGREQRPAAGTLAGEGMSGRPAPAPRLSHLDRTRYIVRAMQSAEAASPPQEPARRACPRGPRDSPQPAPRQRRGARAQARRPGIRARLQRPHDRRRVPRAGRVADRPAGLPTAHLQSGVLGAALRAGHLRGLQGLPPAGGRDRHLPARRQRRALRRVGRAPRHARFSRRPLRRGRRRAHPPGPRLGPGGGGHEPLHPPARDRDRALPRGPPVRELHLPHHRVPGGAVLPEGPAPGDGLDLGGVRARRAGRHGRRKVRRQLRREPRRPAPGARPGLRAGRLARRARSARTSRRWAA